MVMYMNGGVMLSDEDVWVVLEFFDMKLIGWCVL